MSRDDYLRTVRVPWEELEAHRRARFHAFLWERQWWHEGRQKGWWES